MSELVPADEAAPDPLPEHVPTVRVAHVTGIEALEDPDPTEDYHEASRMDPGVVDPLVNGAARLEGSGELRVAVTRAVKRNPHRPFVRLPSPALGAATLSDALAARRSTREYGTAALRLEELATLLHAAYGVTGTLGGPSRPARVAPSGGALYPLELYVACLRVEDLDVALFHFDPLRHGLELLRPIASNDEVARLTPYVELLAPSAAVVLVTGMLWRSRFKYGHRAYRFTLIEAGHAAHGLLLAAAALRLAAVPVGGFFDRRVDAFLEVDGLYETALYLLAVGAENA
ncbi:MAG TPA: SagB/ThcOx family dehydrogenase [Gaiella sp.]